MIIQTTEKQGKTGVVPNWTGAAAGKCIYNPIKDRDELSDPRVRQVYQKEIFSSKTTGLAKAFTNIRCFFYPTDKGPYNYNAAATDVDANGKFKIPPNAGEV